MGFEFNLNRRKQGDGDQAAGCVGKVFLTGFLSIFVVAGIFAAVMITGQAQKGFDEQGWVERPCTIVSSEVAITSSDEDPYEPRITYTYTHGGRDYRSSTISNSDPQTRDYGDAQALVLANPVGSTGKAYVNPNTPSEAVLVTGGLNSLGMVAGAVAFLTFFSGIPFIIIVTTWWPKRRDKGKSKANEARKRGKESIGGTVVGLIFGVVFTAAGVGTLIPLAILPLYRTVAAQSWDTVSATVERSDILSYSDSDGTTYRIDILYFYEIDDQRYGSNRYSFSQIGSSSGYSGKQAIVQQYPVGEAVDCFVDPDDPTRAALHRGLSLSNLWGLFPIPFLAVGLGCLFATLTGRFPGSDGSNARTRRKRAKLSLDEGMPDPTDHEGPAVLKPGKSRLGVFAFLCFFALFWNGIISIFITDIASGHLKGSPDWCATIFMIPFVLVGLAVPIAAIRQLMLVFAPKVVIELDRRSLPIGGATKLNWHLVGGRGKVTAITIKLVGEEQATYRRGTDSVTDTEAFHEQFIFGDPDAEADPYDPSTSLGDALLQIPEDTMHSFDASNNKIVWRLEVKAKVKGWPDPTDTYDITVLPMGTD